jgi:hypothetical protein
VFADARPAALLPPASHAVVLADARPAALFVLASSAVVLADAQPAALLAAASSAVVFADARSAVLLAVCYAGFRTRPEGNEYDARQFNGYHFPRMSRRIAARVTIKLFWGY